MTFFLGVDGGGTKTVAVLTDDSGAELGRGVGGVSNFQAAGAELAQTSLSDAIRAAFSQAGLPPQPVQRIVLGVAGVGRPEDRAWLATWCKAQNLAEDVEIITDAELLLWAGTPEGWGVGCVSGTGSIAFGIDQQGKKARAGGWGYILGDEGSGYAIGLAALRAVAQSADGRAQSTSLLGRVLHAWNLAEPTALIPLVYHGGVTRERIAALTELVADEARGGDSTAVAILRQAARELALAVVSVARQLQFSGAVPCALGGGVLVNQAWLVEQVVEDIRQSGVRVEPVELVADPVRGAVRLAVSRRV